MTEFSPEYLKKLTDRARTVLSYIDEERARCTALILAIDDKSFLLYCINEAFCQPSEIDHWRQRYEEEGRAAEPQSVAEDDDIESLM